MITETGRIAEMLCAPFFVCFTEKQAEILVTIAPFRVSNTKISVNLQRWNEESLAQASTNNLNDTKKL